MTSFVLDASALLALLQGEPGSDVVSTALASGAAMSAVNLSEVVAKLGDAGMGEADIHAALDLLGITIIDITADLAYVAGLLRPLARAIGLSLGDRFCLALAKQLNLPALTADRSWAALALGISVTAIR